MLAIGQELKRLQAKSKLMSRLEMLLNMKHNYKLISELDLTERKEKSNMGCQDPGVYCYEIQSCYNVSQINHGTNLFIIRMLQCWNSSAACPHGRLWFSTIRILCWDVNFRVPSLKGMYSTVARETILKM